MLLVGGELEVLNCRDGSRWVGPAKPGDANGSRLPASGETGAAGYAPASDFMNCLIQGEMLARFSKDG